MSAHSSLARIVSSALVTNTSTPATVAGWRRSNSLRLKGRDRRTMRSTSHPVARSRTLNDPSSRTAIRAESMGT
jgi:hypothetical protein